MALTTADNRVVATGDGSTVTFYFNRLLYDAGHLQVYLDDTLQSASYTVYGVPGASTYVTFSTAPANGVQVLLLRVVPLTQLSVYDVAGAFPAKTTEKNLDLAIMALQQFDEINDRSLRMTVEETGTSATTILPTVSERANKYFAWNSNGEPIAIDPATASGTSVLSTGSTTARLLADRFADYINAYDYGVIDGADNTVALQAAIDAAISQQKKLWLPAIEYLISSPLYIMKWSGSAFSYFSLEIEGAKMPWPDETTNIQSARIVPNFSNVPPIIIQNARSVKMSNVTVIGLNTFDIGNGLTAPYYPEMMTNSTFVIGACRDSRYSPYAGICIDPFGTSIPADGGYPGLSGYYVASAAGSSNVLFDNVITKNFIVGFCVTPNGTTQNAEDITWRNCRAEFNKVGVAICQSQSRNCNWYGGDCAFNLVGFDDNLYGDRTGTGINIYGCNMSGKYLFNLSGRYGSPSRITVFAESFASIGFLGVGAASSANAFVLEACNFTFSSMGGTFPDHHLVAYSPVTFIGCEINNRNFQYDAPFRFFRHSTVPIRFVGTQIIGEIQDEFPLSLSVGSASVNFIHAKFESCLYGIDSARGNANGKAVLANDHFAYQSVGYLSGNVLPLGSRLKFGGADTTKLFFDTGAELLVSLGSKTVTTGANGTATFTATDEKIIRTGDLIYATDAVTLEGPLLTTALSLNYICLGIVTNISGTTITISGWPQSLATGTYTLYEWWWPRFHGASTGDTHNNTTLDNVTNATEWKVGQKIRGTWIVDGTYITNIAGTTFTLSKATTGTGIGVRLYDADIHSLTGAAV